MGGERLTPASSPKAPPHRLLMVRHEHQLSPSRRGFVSRERDVAVGVDGRDHEGADVEKEIEESRQVIKAYKHTAQLNKELDAKKAFLATL